MRSTSPWAAASLLLFLLAPAAPAQDEMWARRAGGPGHDSASGVAIYPDGGVAVTGSFHATATFGEGEPGETRLTSKGGTDLFLARYRPDGTLAWARRAGGALAVDSRGVSVSATGAATVAGTYLGTATFGEGEPRETRLPEGGLFLARYGPDGALAWARKAEGPAIAVAIAGFPDGGCALTGTLVGTTIFGLDEPHETTLTAQGASDVFVARYGPAGRLVWAQRAHGDAANAGTAIASLPDGGVVVTGAFAETIRFDNTVLTSFGGQDLFVARYRADGSVAWAASGGSAGADGGTGIAPLPDGGAVVLGTFTQTATLGDGAARVQVNAAGPREILLARFRADGTLAWARAAGHGDFELGRGIAMAGDDILVAGSFAGTLIFGWGEERTTRVTAGGQRDLFVARFGEGGALVAAGQSKGESVEGTALAVKGRIAYVAGRFDESATFARRAYEARLSAEGGFDLFLARLLLDAPAARER